MNQDQILAYIETAQAHGLRDALKTDAALLKLAESPLNLSMLTLAHGAKRTIKIPTNAPIIELRHRLMEAFAARMMQRKERRDRNIPMDDSTATDVPPSDYQFSPEVVHTHLEWLATRMSISNRTMFAYNELYDVAREYVRKHATTSSDVWAIGLTNGVYAMVAISPVALTTAWSFNGLLEIAVLAAAVPLVAVGAAIMTVREVRSSGSFSGKIEGLSVLIVSGVSFMSHPHVSIVTVIALISLALPIFYLISSVRTLVALGFFVTWGTLIGILISQFPYLILCGIGTLIGLFCASMLPEIPLLNLPEVSVPLWIALTQIVGAFWIPWPRYVHLLIWGACLMGMTLRSVSETMAILGAFILVSATIAMSSWQRNAAPAWALSLCASLSNLVMPGPWMVYASLIGSAFALGFEKTQSGIRQTSFLSPVLWWVLGATGRLPRRPQRFFAYCNQALLIKTSPGLVEFSHLQIRDHFALRSVTRHFLDRSKSKGFDFIGALKKEGNAGSNTVQQLALMGEDDLRLAAVGALKSEIVPGKLFETLLADADPAIRSAAVHSLSLYSQEDLYRRAINDDAEVVRLAARKKWLNDGWPSGLTPIELILPLLELWRDDIELLREAATIVDHLESCPWHRIEHGDICRILASWSPGVLASIKDDPDKSVQAGIGLILGFLQSGEDHGQ